MEQITEINDPRFVKALAHPLRVQILRVLETKVASPNEISMLAGVPVSNVSYHMRQLAALGLVEMVREERRRGAFEHYYQSLGRVRISADAWGQAPRSARASIVGGVISETVAVARQAADAGGFDREDIVLSRRILKTDEAGFKEIAAATAEYLDRLQQLEQEIVTRILADGREDAETSDTVIVTMVFDASPPDDQPS